MKKTLTGGTLGTIDFPKKQEQIDMPESETDKTTRRIRPPIGMSIIPLMIGLFGFYRVAQSPHFDSYRTIDVAQLLVSGAGFGAALVILMFTLLRPRI
jgi:hypothetical protein